MQQVHVNAAHKVVGVPYSDAVRNLCPDAKSVALGGETWLVVPHKPDITFMLRRLGYDVPPPILSHYDWCGGAPFEVQKNTCAMLTTHTRAYVLNGMGCGKTRSALWAWDYLRGNNCAGKLLIVAPLSTLKFTWARELFVTLPHRKYAVLHGTREQRLKSLASDADVYIVNHDGPKILAEALAAREDIDTLVIDELAVYRNGRADRTKVMKKLAARMAWVWGMTGSPTPNGPTDVWAQATIVTPNRVPKYYTRFRDEMMLRVTQFKWVPKPDAVERAFDILQPAVRYTLDDIVELPERIERTVEVEMGARQARAYKDLAAECYAAILNKEITAANAGAAMNKLLQVATGWVYAKDRDVISLDNDARIKALLDAVEATDRKVLVFAPFKHALDGISEAFAAEGIDHAVVSGDTAMGARSDIFNAFQNTSKYRVLLAHPQCLAHGITLTAADTIIWFAPVTSLEIYDQANHRIRRVGQQHKQLILHLQSTPVERKLYTLLQNKQKVQDQLLELFEEATVTNPQQ